MLVSIIIPTCNRKAMLQRCLLALERQSFPDFRDKVEIIVVNDGSSDGTAGFLSGFRPRSPVSFTVINQKNSGPATARNQGISCARGKLIAFLDDDCVPTPRWLSQLVHDLPSDPRCAGIGGKIIRLHHTILSRYLDENKPIAHEVHNDGTVSYLVTANSLYRKEALGQVHGFHEGFRHPGGEDPDLSWRIKNKGYYLAVSPGAIVKHEHRDSIKGLYCTMYSYGRAAKMLRTLKHPVCLSQSVFRLAKDMTLALRRFSPRQPHSFREKSLYFLADCTIMLGLYNGYRSIKEPAKGNENKLENRKQQ